jgi:hypothetical protein
MEIQDPPLQNKFIGELLFVRFLLQLSPYIIVYSRKVSVAHYCSPLHLPARFSGDQVIRDNVWTQ